MAGAYACIANNGVYIEPIFYTRVEDEFGKILLKNKQASRKVYSQDTAYVLKEILTEPVRGSNGTAKICQVPGFETAAKTGTTDNCFDKWLCGFTNCYTAVTWYGFDESEEITEGANSMANQIWANVMKNIHKDLINSDFEKVRGVKEVKICRESGKVASNHCTNTYTEYFRNDTNVPNGAGFILCQKCP